MVVHDDFRVGGVELHMGDPAEGHLFLISQVTCGRIIDTEITAQLFILHTLVDIVYRSFVESAALRLRIIVEASAVGHRHTQPTAVVADMGEGRHPVVRHVVEHHHLPVEAHLADTVVLYEIDHIPFAVE